MSIRYKYARLFVEGYNFTNADEVYSALESNQIGVKIQPAYKEKTKWDYTCEKLRTFFRKCEEFKIKDTTYGVQLLLSKVDDPYCLEVIIREDGLYELLKSRKKPWVKELKEFQSVMNEKFWDGSTVHDLHALEKAIQNNQSNHGKAAKGGGDIEGVKTAYDDGTWKLMIPLSFEGEKAAAFYIKDGKETPTEWCTRCDRSYYNSYSKNAPLYIIRNMKTGKSYQMAFTKDDEEENNVSYMTCHFLDQNDAKGDEITNGDLTKIPDELLKHIKIPFGPMKGKTMADYKVSPEEDPLKGQKNIADLGKEKASKIVEVDPAKVKTAKTYFVNNFSSGSRGESVPVLIDKLRNKKVYKMIFKNATYDYRGQNHVKENKLDSYLQTGVREKFDQGIRAGKVRYYIEGEPEKYIEITNYKSLSDRPSVLEKSHNLDSYKDWALGTLLDIIVKLDRGNVISKGRNPFSKTGETISTLIPKKAEEENRERKNVDNKFKNIFEIINKKYKDRLNKIGIGKVDFKERSPENQRMRGNAYDGMMGRVLEFYSNDVNSSYDLVWFAIPRDKPFKKENIEVDVLEPNSHRDKIISKFKTPENLQLAWEIMRDTNTLWRRSFQSDIIEKRVNKEYSSNMYEEVNYFPY